MFDRRLFLIGQRQLLRLAAAVVLCAPSTALAQPSAAENHATPAPGLHDQTQRVVLLAPTLDAYSTQELVRGLASLGVRAVSVREAKLDPALEACNTFGCLGQVARASQGSAALVSLEANSEGARTLLLVLVDATGSNAQTRTRIGQAGLTQALITAWKETSLSLALAGQAMIHFETRPSGATVWFDGSNAGTSPFARQVSPGKHRVSVELDGFTSQERVIDAQAGSVQRFELLLKREPRFNGKSLAAVPRSQPSAWNYVFGGTLALIAVPALIASLNALVNDGQCLRARGSSCEDRADFGGQSAALLTVGVVALAGGSTLLVARPFEDTRR